MDWKEGESRFLTLRECLLKCAEVIASLSSRRALELRGEVAHNIRRLSEVLERGEREWSGPKHSSDLPLVNSRNPVLIPEEHVKKVCRAGGGAMTCCLIVAGRHGFECMLGTNLEPILRNRALAGESFARSVNCDGPPEAPPQVGDAVYHCPRCGNPGIMSFWEEYNCCTGCANHLRLGHPDPKGLKDEY